MRMVERIRERWRARPPGLDWVQLEVTSRCTAACTYCPRAAARTGWRGRDLSFETFEALLPDLARTRYVHLQGWGEPLLHPRFLAMVERLSAAGLRIGTTSNGVLLDRASARALVDAEVEVVALSVAGADAATHDAVRSGAPLAGVIAAAQTLYEARAGRPYPRIHLAYMLLRSGLSSLDRLPELLREAPVDEIVVSSLSLVTCPELAPEAVLAEDDDELRALRARLDRVATEVERRGARIHWQLIVPSATPRGCPENPGRSVFVDADGQVHPCVLAGLPLEDPLEAYPWGSSTPQPQVSFGEVGASCLGAVWRSPAARRFRSRADSTAPPPACAGCLKRQQLALETEVDLVPTTF